MNFYMSSSALNPKITLALQSLPSVDLVFHTVVGPLRAIQANTVLMLRHVSRGQYAVCVCHPRRNVVSSPNFDVGFARCHLAAELSADGIESVICWTTREQALGRYSSIVPYEPAVRVLGSRVRPIRSVRFDSI